MTTTRRVFLRNTGLVGAGALTAAAMGMPSRAGATAGRSVAVFGAGVAGLTAAHELAERGFAVTVYERRALGGKARSIGVPDSATGGRLLLSAEHGFRFFPGFYKNVTETMRRVPFAGNANGCWDNLTRATSYLGARSGGRDDLTIPFPFPLPPKPFPYTPQSFMATLRSGFESAQRLSPYEVGFISEKLGVYVTSCDERRLGQWDGISWSDYIRADRMSAEYRALIGDGIIRNLSAIKSKDASTHSIGLVGEQTAFSALGMGNEPGGSVDRVLDGSTSEMWLDPWIAYLRTLGVRFRVGWSLQSLGISGGRIDSAVVVDGSGGTQSVAADWYIPAVPVEKFAPLISPAMLAADPSLAGIRRLRTDWMNGLMFFLKEQVPITPGHVNYVDSTWAITSISQAQFWKRDFATYGDGTVRDCLSTIISDWFAPGLFNGGRAARECSPAEIAAEVWAQMKAHLNDTGTTVLRDDMVHSWFLDPGIVAPGTPSVDNQDPLFIQSPGSWKDRPASQTAIENLFLAGDWVRTNINVTTMEGANEGGRQAANAVLDAAGSSASRATLKSFYQPPEFEAFKLVDRELYKLGRPNLFDIVDPRTP